MKKKVSIGIIVVILLGFGLRTYIYQPHVNIQKEEAVYIVKAATLVEAYRNDPMRSDQNYLNKVIEVKGQISRLENKLVIVEDKIVAQFEIALDTTSSEIHFKGRCLGYDELLEEIRFDQCYIIK